MVELFVYNKNFDKIGEVDNYISVKWEEDYRGEGNFMLVTEDRPYFTELFQQGNYIRRSGNLTAMVVWYTEIDTTIKRFIVRGFSTSYLLSQRIIRASAATVNNIERGIYDLINQAIVEGGRGLSSFETAPLKGLSATQETQFTYKNLLDSIIDLAAIPDYGFFTEFDRINRKHVFTVYKGLDRSVGNGINQDALFSDQAGNLNNLEIIIDYSIYKNMAYVGGEGEEDERIWVEVNPGGVTGLDRFEMPVDARDLRRENSVSDAEYRQKLISRGLSKLNEHIKLNTFIAEPDTQSERPTLKWGVDYYLGDIVTCKSAQFNQRIDTRITKYSEVRENNITTIKCTLGEPLITQSHINKIIGGG